MKKLIIFALGMASIVTLIPLLESITELICSWLEVLKAIPMKRVLVVNNEIADLQAKLEPQSTSCIGFVHNEEYPNDDEWEEDKIKNKIGFR